jgi:cytochrome P450
MAGHETTAVALTWAIHLLARAPDVQAALATELDSALDGRSPGVADLPRLPYTEACVFEALRRYPPAYALSREAVTATSVGGCPLPRHGIAFISVWASHHDPHDFPEPDAFRPERWLDGLARRLPRGRYVPFGEGPRKCLGAGFAMQEMTLALATIVARWQLGPTDERIVPTRPAVTLRPAEVVRVRVVPRRHASTPAED